MMTSESPQPTPPQKLPPAETPKEKIRKKELQAEALRQRKIVTEVIYPILLKHAKNVKDAKNICKNFVIATDAAFFKDVEKYQTFKSSEAFNTLNLKGLMNEGKDFTAEWAWVEALKDEKISTAKGLIDGLEKELTRLTTVEELKRPLADLKTEFL